MKYSEIKPFKHIKKAYIELIDGQLVNEAAFNFYTACKFMQMEINGFSSTELESMDVTEDSVYYGGVTTMLSVFKKMGIPAVAPLDIPKELNDFVGRKIYNSTIDKVISNNEIKYPIFIKPADTGKLFNGSIVDSKNEMITFQVYNKTEKRDIPIAVSEIVNFVSEYRTFILNGEIIDCRKYLGDYKLRPDYFIIESAINKYATAPIAYSLDFGVTDKGDTLLIEANDSYSLGTYGLDSYPYFRMIMMRWLQITNCVFHKNLIEQ